MLPFIFNYLLSGCIRAIKVISYLLKCATEILHTELYFYLNKHYRDRVKANAEKLILNSFCLTNCIPESLAYDYV